ncbi:uncharacterized protein LOC5515358 isoform X2 [Nematostella vectensis]|uniref:uncharacterized protein LOC5515358 isoform X2 n=1 Tax=Nematostella vectensis TaxID=45351 RepID=UPI00207738EF|nr:uncharacterized protein LOC5515358 isoform X2 [Nematostella vectensis]
MANGSGNYSFFNHKLRMPTRTSPRNNKLLERRTSSENTLHRLESLSILSPASAAVEDVVPFRGDVFAAGLVPHPPDSPKSSDENSKRTSSALRFRGKKRTRNESPRTSGSEDEKQIRKFAFTSKVSPLTSPRRSSTGSIGSLEGLECAADLIRRKNLISLQPLKGIKSDKDLVSNFKSYQQSARSSSPINVATNSKQLTTSTPIKVMEKNENGKEEINDPGHGNKLDNSDFAQQANKSLIDKNVRAIPEFADVTSSLSSEDSFTNVSGNDDDDDDNTTLSSSSTDEDLKQISENIAKEISTKRYPDATLPSLPRNSTLDISGKYESIGPGTYEKCASPMYQNADNYENTKPQINSPKYSNVNGTVSSTGDSSYVHDSTFDDSRLYETLSGYENQKALAQVWSTSTGDLNHGNTQTQNATDARFVSETNLSAETGSGFSSVSRNSLLPRVPAKVARMRNKNFLREEMEKYFPDHKVGVFVATWNMHEEKEVPGFLDDFLLPENVDFLQDIYVIGLQESTSSRSEWEIRLQETLGPSHVLMHSCSFGVLHLAIFVRRELVWFCSAVTQESIATRPGHMIKTKGGLAVGFSLFGTSFLFINSHLTSDEGKARDRVNDYNKIRKSLNLQGEEKPWVDNSPDVTDRFDRVFWLGDFNFRVDMERTEVDKLIATYQEQESPDYKELLKKDQLSRLMSKELVLH